jgi:large subunit ribosomal protein L35
MPKMKSRKGAAKRFEITRTGKVRRRRAFDNHMFEKKTSPRKRRLQSSTTVSQADAKRIRTMLGE